MILEILFADHSGFKFVNDVRTNGHLSLSFDSFYKFNIVSVTIIKITVITQITQKDLQAQCTI